KARPCRDLSALESVAEQAHIHRLMRANVAARLAVAIAVQRARNARDIGRHARERVRLRRSQWAARVDGDVAWQQPHLEPVAVGNVEIRYRQIGHGDLLHAERTAALIGDNAVARLVRKRAGLVGHAGTARLAVAVEAGLAE